MYVSTHSRPTNLTFTVTKVKKTQYNIYHIKMQNIKLYIGISPKDLHTFSSHLVQSLLEALYPGKIYSKDSEIRKK